LTVESHLRILIDGVLSPLIVETEEANSWDMR
jgi:hypothetical protein